MARTLSLPTKALALALAALVGASALTGCTSSAGGEATASEQAETSTAGYHQDTSAETSGAGGEIDGSGRVHYGRMPDSDQLLVIRTEKGTTAYGKVPVIEGVTPSSTAPLKVMLAGFSTSRVIYVYIDGHLVGAYTVADGRAKLTLAGLQLESGTHSVEAIQYAGDDPSAAPTLYKCAQYAVAG